MVGNPRPHGAVTGVWRGSRAPHTEADWQAPQSGGTQIRLLLQNGQEVAHWTHCARHATTPNWRYATRLKPLCRRPNIRRGHVPATNMEARTTPHMEHINPNVRRIPKVPAGAQEQISWTRRGTTAPAPALTQPHTETTIPGNNRRLERTKHPSCLAAFEGSAHL